MVAEGRDQGTVVFPDAFRKFFLTATLAERARRRHAEFAARGETIDPGGRERDLRERDDRDEARAIAPMKPADDARILDTTGLDLDAVVALIEGDVRESADEKGSTRHEPPPGPRSDRLAAGRAGTAPPG